jgi:MFS family permease
VFSWMLSAVLFLTEVWQYRELKAGLAMSPTAVLATLVAIGTGRLIPRYGLRATVVAGAVFVAAGAGLFAVAIPQHPRFLAFWLPAAAVGAVGMGAVTTALSTAAALSVQPHRFAAATGLNQTARQIGGALGVAVLAAILAGFSGSRLDAYRSVFGVCALFAAAAGVVGLLLATPPRPPAAQPPVAVRSDRTAA